MAGRPDRAAPPQGGDQDRPLAGRSLELRRQGIKEADGHQVGNSRFHRQLAGRRLSLLERRADRSHASPQGGDQDRAPAGQSSDFRGRRIEEAGGRQAGPFPFHRRLSAGVSGSAVVVTVVSAVSTRCNCSTVPVVPRQLHQGDIELGQGIDLGPSRLGVGFLGLQLDQMNSGVSFSRMGSDSSRAFNCAWAAWDASF